MGLAWLDETWRTLERTADPGHLYAHKAISGPILFWEDSRKNFASASGGLYLDVMAEGDKRVIVLKAADVPAEERVSLFDAVAATAPSGSKAPARRTLRGKTFRVRIWDVTGDSPATGAAVALDAQRFATYVPSRQAAEPVRSAREDAVPNAMPSRELRPRSKRWLSEAGTPGCSHPCEGAKPAAFRPQQPLASSAAERLFVRSRCHPWQPFRSRRMRITSSGGGSQRGECRACVHTIGVALGGSR